MELLLNLMDFRPNAGRPMAHISGGGDRHCSLRHAAAVSDCGVPRYLLQNSSLLINNSSFLIHNSSSFIKTFIIFDTEFIISNTNNPSGGDRSPADIHPSPAHFRAAAANLYDVFGADGVYSYLHQWPHKDAVLRAC